MSFTGPLALIVPLVASLFAAWVALCCMCVSVVRVCLVVRVFLVVRLLCAWCALGVRLLCAWCALGVRLVCLRC